MQVYQQMLESGADFFEGDYLPDSDFTRYSDEIQGDTKVCREQKYDPIRARYAKTLEQRVGRRIAPEIYANSADLCDAITLLEDYTTGSPDLSETLANSSPTVLEWWRTFGGEDIIPEPSISSEDINNFGQVMSDYDQCILDDYKRVRPLFANYIAGEAGIDLPEDFFNAGNQGKLCETLPFLRAYYNAPLESNGPRNVADIVSKIRDPDVRSWAQNLIK